jgi:hypothetical protein
LSDLIAKTTTLGQAALLATEQSHLGLSRLLSDMIREIERGNNINLTNFITLLTNVFPPDQEKQANATLHQALIAATLRTTKRDIQRRSERKDQPIETESNKPYKLKRKYDYEQGEPKPWDRMLRAVNDRKSEVGCLRKLLIERGIMYVDPPRKPNQQGAV